MQKILDMKELRMRNKKTLQLPYTEEPVICLPSYTDCIIIVTPLNDDAE
jgi:hypothetical protein